VTVAFDPKPTATEKATARPGRASCGCLLLWGVSLIGIGLGRHGVAAGDDGVDQMWIRSTTLLN
jgi:hypothetical protein